MNGNSGVPFGAILIGIGLLLVAAGAVLLAGRHVQWLYSWFGHLPGDFRYEGEHTAVYAPIMSMLVLSAVVSLVVFLAQKLLR
jgi:hypothetical protein